MSLRSPRGARLGLIFAAALGAVLMPHAGTAATRICIDRASPSASLDLRIARAALNVAPTDVVTAVYFEGYGRGGEGLPPSRFARMASTDCDLIMGFPVEREHPHLPPRVAATAAYATTGFVLITPALHRAESLAKISDGSEVGIAQLDTYAGVRLRAESRLVMHVYPSDGAMLGALVAQRVAAAIAWEPTVQQWRQARAGGRALHVMPLEGEHMVWQLEALYAPDQPAAAGNFERGLARLAREGRLSGLIAPFRVAATPPPRSRVDASLSGQAWRDRAAGDRAARYGGLRVARYTMEVAGGGPAVRRAAAAHPPIHSKAPALYTAQQAEQGALAYFQNCAMCHGVKLDGQLGGYPGPALKGEDFADPSYDFRVKDIFDFVAKQMPAATPGSLTHDEYVDIMAFILRENGYPPGPRPLTYEFAEKSQVKVRYYGP